ncbi:MAG: transcription termination factor NusA [Myxococcales bacterium]|nr:transcription termination factor NusA [Myxococcales bacterium]
MELGNLNAVMDQVARDKNVSKEILVEALEAAMLTAARKVFGMARDIEAHFDDESGDVEIFEFRTVNNNPGTDPTQISVEEAQDYDPGCEEGDSLGVKIDKGGLGRIAAQTAKQVIIQRVREAERENVFNEYRDRKEELATGMVRRFERGNIIVDLGRAEAVLPLREQCPRESYRINDRIQAYVLDVNKQSRGSQIVLSRTSPGLLMKLFEMEVPEIYEGIVKIEAAAREPGMRSKIAVSSTDRDVDPVGACVGMKGSRVQAVVQELRGEKVDIVPFDPDPARFVCNALAPAEVSRVLVDETNHLMEIIVPDDQLSLAIGRRGQNVRLASQLSGWRLDIVSESKVREIKERAFRSLGRLEKISEIQLQTLYNYGIRSADDLLKADHEFLAKIPGIGDEVASRIMEDAKRVVAEESQEADQARQQQGEQARVQARDMLRAEARLPERLPEAERIIRVRGVDKEMVSLLEAAGLHFVEDMAEMKDLLGMADKTGLTPQRLDELCHAAHMFLQREALGEDILVFNGEPGPDEGYEPSELLKHLLEVQAEAMA